eukprot:TRINITY_DN13159_c0_g1_i2.p1 TRINITY_DN13159_c0_g1~~TRINITY_DN13159_c0_g1_i2.p1  ORF type:complete len:243 (+),score=49.53 TRINITY_DN13159_c0_g1_i2:609-1337(+)
MKQLSKAKSRILERHGTKSTEDIQRTVGTAENRRSSTAQFQLRSMKSTQFKEEEKVDATVNENKASRPPEKWGRLSTNFENSPEKTFAEGEEDEGYFFSLIAGRNKKRKDSEVKTSPYLKLEELLETRTKSRLLRKLSRNITPPILFSEVEKRRSSSGMMLTENPIRKRYLIKDEDKRIETEVSMNRYDPRKVYCHKVKERPMPKLILDARGSFSLSNKLSLSTADMSVSYTHLTLPTIYSV